jgi:hypothetical protein
MKRVKNTVYEAPRAEIIEIECQGFLCASGGQGGTEGMNLINVDPFSNGGN